MVGTKETVVAACGIKTLFLQRVTNGGHFFHTFFWGWFGVFFGASTMLSDLERDKNQHVVSAISLSFHQAFQAYT
jgi:hypothetical protein